MAENSKGFTVFNGVALLGQSALTSSVIDMRHQYGLSVHAVLSSSYAVGAASGTFRVEVSNYDGNGTNNTGSSALGGETWITVTDSVSSTKKHQEQYFYNSPTLYCGKARVVYQAVVQFTGALDCRVVVRG